MQGYESVVLFLASLPGVLEQRDGRRDSPLAVARRRGHRAIEELLVEAGARAEPATLSKEGPPRGSMAAGDAKEEEYCSWSAEERLRYRRGGQGVPTRQPGRGRGGGRAGGGPGRGGWSSWSSGGGTTGTRPEPRQPRCPW
jgi:hypothetical protein